MKDYIAVDLETTGLDPKKNKIIEIGAVRVRDGLVTDSFQTFVNPGWRLDGRIMELTGITQEDLQDAPEIEDAVLDFYGFAGEDVLLGHSLMFDYSFLKRAIVNHGGNRAFERQGIDTLKIARRYLASLPSRSLGELCTYYQIPHRAHRALEDARAAHFLYQKMLSAFQTQENGNDFEPQPLVYKVKKEGPATKNQKERLQRMLDHFKIEPEYDVERLTKNEASRIMDQITSQHGRFSPWGE